MAWTRGKYNIKDVQSNVILTTITHIYTRGKYNVYNLDNGNECIVIFGDQTALLKLVNDNLGSIFALKLLSPTSRYYKYSITTSAGDVEAFTLAAAIVVMHRHEDTTRTLKVTDKGFIIIE